MNLSLSACCSSPFFLLGGKENKELRQVEMTSVKCCGGVFCLFFLLGFRVFF